VNLKATRSDAGRTPAPQDVHVRRDELHDVLVNKTRYFIKLKGNLFSRIWKLVVSLELLLQCCSVFLWMIARLCPRVYARAPIIVWSGQNVLA
jgi:hypothetical protein